ncbi:glycosyltransferase [Desulfarculus baarsii]|nr:glycosyltransferase [Desulfarculus baarsii]
MSMLASDHTRLFQRLARLWQQLYPYKHRMIQAMFIPQYYKLQAGLDQAVTDEQAWRHWLLAGHKREIALNPLFDAEYYRQVWADKEPRIASEPSAFMHWLKHGLQERIIPTVLFDEKFYLHAYPDVVACGMWSFEHFIRFGVNERRWPNGLFSSGRYMEKNNDNLNGLAPYYHFLMYGDDCGFNGDTHNFDPREFGMPSWRDLYRLAVDKNREFFDDRIQCGVLAEVLERAARIEPLINKPAVAARVLHIPPFMGQQTGTYAAAKKARLALRRPHYTNVVCIPHCRVGGAARVAGLFCQALAKIFPDEPTLLILTDLSVFARPDWFPDNIEIFDLSAIVDGLSAAHKQTVLMDVLRGTTPERIVNINSRLCWDTYMVFGQQLSQWSRLFAYFFCYDINPQGHKVGYPIEFFAPSYKFMSGYFFDNQALVDELEYRYLLKNSSEHKSKAVWTPIESDSTLCLHAQKLQKKSEVSSRWRAFWAGRLDRQKRYDIVVEIANMMPELDIWTWGHAVLDGGFDTKNLPPNMKFFGTFESFDDLPLHDCDFWLYTSEWDGLPTMLLETGVRGIATVASRVGGTADVINEETGWPVDDFLDPRSYVMAIRQMMGDPGACLAKAGALRDLIAARHSMNHYATEIEAALK